MLLVFSIMPQNPIQILMNESSNIWKLSMDIEDTTIDYSLHFSAFLSECKTIGTMHKVKGLMMIIDD